MKKIFVATVFTLAIVSASFADTVSDFNDALDSFLGEVNTALPDNAVIGGTWSDAYIGQIIGIPPHFGIGLATGVTRFPSQGFKDAMEVTKTDLPVDTLILPNAAIEGRIGGFIVPFDIGFRLGMMPETELMDFKVGFLHYGVDARYAVMKGGLVLPAISVGLGYYHTDGTISIPIEAGNLFTGIDPSFTAGQNLDLGLDFATDVLELKAQISKSLIIITPYAGLGVSMANSESSYKLSSSIASVNHTRADTVYGARVFGGFSFNLLVLKFDATGSYNVLSGNWGANLGARIQL